MALSRNSDPATSHAAAHDIEACGAAESHRALCLDAVQRNPGMTAAEIARETGLERHEPSRRLPELRDRNLVCNGHERTCAVKGRRSLTWFPTEEGTA